MNNKWNKDVLHKTRNWPTAAIILFLSTSFLSGCGSSGTSAPVQHSQIANISNGTANVTNSVVTTTEMGNSTLYTNSPSAGTEPANRLSSDSNSTNATAPAQRSSTRGEVTSKVTSSKSEPTHVTSKTSGSIHNGTSTAPSSEGSSSSNAAHSGSSSVSIASPRPSGIDHAKTGILNNELGQLDYTGSNRSLFDSLVVQMAQGAITPGAAKTTIQGLKPWDAIWNDAPGGPATYQFQVHDVEAYTFQTKTWSDSVTSQEFQVHGFLDDTAYQKFAVYWDASNQEYTVAMLAVGFYYYSQ